MISKQAKRYCCEELSKIENYEQAISDKTQVWDCHHKNEINILSNGDIVFNSIKELKENGKYYHCPAKELIFLTRKEHLTLHCKGNKELGKKISQSKKGVKLSEETKLKMSLSHKGKSHEPYNSGWKHTEEWKDKAKDRVHKKSSFYQKFGMTMEEYKQVHNIKESTATIRRRFNRGEL